MALLTWAGRWPRRAEAAPACTLTPAQTEGPFYFNPDLLRRDITEGRPGTPVRLQLQVVDAGTCAPIRDALVDVWHTDAAGLYSGFPNQGEQRVDTRGLTFLRGMQVTGADGVAELETIYPGWYPGRVAHIHFKVHVDDRTYVTSQLYFHDAVSRAVYDTEPYAMRGQSPITNATDPVLRPGQLETLLADVVPDGAGYQMAYTIGIDLPRPTATALPSATPTSDDPVRPATPGRTAACLGDCSGDGIVTVDELVIGVNQALGHAPAEGCSAFHRDADYRVTVSELVTAVNNLLSGCPG